VVAKGWADRCEVQVAYAIGVAEPVSVNVDTFGTGVHHDIKLARLVRDHFALTPTGIIETLDLRRPRFRQTAAYGHFGRSGDAFTWERLDRADELRAASERL
jgi:S-adenosylmethionine synthetase